MLFENARDMIQSVAPDGKFIFVNPAWLKTMGYTQDNLKAITLLDIIHPDCKDYYMDIIILLDKDLNIIKCNKRFADFVGPQPQELLGRKCYDFFTRNPEQTGHCIGNKIHNGELPEWTKVKTYIGHWFYLSHCPILDEKGEFLHSIVIGTDITPLKNAQQRLMESEEEL
jgi:PAS domain S-box-containing protein